MKDLAKPISKVAITILGIVVMAWTASLTLSFVGRALPELELAKYYALAVFDGGALIWGFTFISSAQGISQRTVSILACAADLAGVGLMVLAETLLSGQTYTAIPDNLGSIAVYGIAGFTFLNVVALFIYHLVSPDVMKSISVRSARDKIEAEALTQLDKRADEIAEEVAQTLAERMIGETLLSLSVMENGQKEKQRDPFPGGGK